MSESSPAGDSGPIGRASLYLGIASSALVFGIGLCAMVGLQQGWLRTAGTVLFVCGASSAFLGGLAALLGAGGLLGARQNRSTAIAGLLLGLLGVCLFLGVMSAIGQGAGP